MNMAEPPDMFDVAISFRAEDEAIASQLFERLRSRHRVFFYSRCQPEVAGEDGLEAYSAIFGKNARLVLVIFRNEWGTEKWTRIEATAIKNRTLEAPHN
ncbi:MAG: toll/interleukin-1 receptor domain-containing protein [Deltaproteobacteria bacterium]|nr:toll/interleukin-1 receptor domain-containing protein [Deltaproteobacteria bacterium]